MPRRHDSTKAMELVSDHRECNGANFRLSIVRSESTGSSIPLRSTPFLDETVSILKGATNSGDPRSHGDAARRHSLMRVSVTPNIPQRAARAFACRCSKSPHGNCPSPRDERSKSGWYRGQFATYSKCLPEPGGQAARLWLKKG